MGSAAPQAARKDAGGAHGAEHPVMSWIKQGKGNGGEPGKGVPSQPGDVAAPTSPSSLQ